MFPVAVLVSLAVRTVGHRESTTTTTPIGCMDEKEREFALMPLVPQQIFMGKMGYFSMLGSLLYSLHFKHYLNFAESTSI